MTPQDDRAVRAAYAAGRKTARLTQRRELARHDLIDEAPHPTLFRFDRSYERVATAPKMRAGMPIRRRVAAADMTADQAHP